MRNKLGNRVGLSLLFTVFVFLTFVVTLAIMAPISYFLIQLGLFPVHNRGTLFFGLMILLLSSGIIGTLVSFAVGRLPLRFIRKVIDATNRLAKGDFSPRLTFENPPELRELSDSFNRMAEELGSLEMLRSEFINDFSHEFKTPIVSIRGFAEMLRDDNLSPEERKEYLDIIIAEFNRLTLLSTNVLNLSHVESKVIVSGQNTFNLGEQLRRSVLLLQTQWEKKNLTLGIDVDDVLFVGNEELLSQVWVNLLDNAVKFTPDHGSIQIETKSDGALIQVIFRDSGYGMKEEEKERIFDKFYRGDLSHHFPGNGLGLPLAKKIVTLHGGTITCESAPGKGSAFTVTLPLPPANS